jgi:hypothetical protein
MLVQTDAPLEQSLIDRAALSRQAVANAVGEAREFLGESLELRVVRFEPTPYRC